MLAGDLGFRAVLVLVLVVFPAIGLLIHRKWRRAVARRDEIRRLLALASEEAARAEFEASIEYAASSSSSSSAAPATVASKETSKRYCAVCYSPTTSRCRRCKSVWYCSSKCQVIHWRQGHKHECSPQLIDPESNDLDSDLTRESVKQTNHDGYYANKSTEECGYESDSSIVHAQNLQRKDDSSIYDGPDGNILVSESSCISASSVVSASFADHKTNDDNSVSEGESSHDLAASEDRLPSPAIKKLEACVDAKKLDQTNSSTSSAPMLEFANNVPQSRNTKEECQCLSTSASDSEESLVPEPSAVSSGFWDGILESSRANRSSQSDNVGTNYEVNRNLSDSRSLLQFSLKFPGDCSSDLHLEGSGLPCHSTAGGPGTSMPIKEAILSGKDALNSSRSSNSTLLTSQQSISIKKGMKKDSNGIKPEEVEQLLSGASFDCSAVVEDYSVAADAVEDHGSSSYSAVRSKHVSSVMKESSQLSMPEKDGEPHNSSELPSLSDANKHSTSTLGPAKSGKDNSGVERNQASGILPNATDGLKTSMLKVDQPRSLKLSRYCSFGVGNGASAKNSEKGLFPYELFVKLYNWKKMELRPCGLINCGNSCYANVVLQCLAFTPPLTAYHLQGLHSNTCAKKDWCFTCEFERLILMAKDRDSSLSPIRILSQIEKIGSHLANGREEDSHEFLRYVIDTMQSICLQEAGLSGLSRSLEEETTLMGLTFGGCLRSKIRCTRCRGKSEQHERMMDLTVEIEGDIETLEEALKKFTGTESLDGENKYHCSRCKSYEKAKKKLTIFEAPNVLTIALKRFQSGKFGKLNKSIRFPEILNLAPYMRGSSDRSPIYQLYGVVVHLDIMNATFSGHYVCYIRNAQNKWFKLDDSTVKPVEKGSVLNKGAYMLFYSRCSPRAPRSIRNSLAFSDVLSKGKDPEGKLSQSDLRRGGGKSLYPSQVSHRFPNETNPEASFPSRVLGFQEFDSSSETSSIFSQSEEGGSTTDSNQESSTSADDLLDHIFGEGLHTRYGYSRNASDSDTSSSSSTSSSPSYATKRSPLSNSDRYTSCRSNPSGYDADDSHSPIEVAGLKGGGRGEVSFLQPDIVKHGRKLENSSNSREIDSCGRFVVSSNPLDSAKSGVHLRSPRKLPD